MGTPLLPDALWNLIQPLLPPSPRRPNGGRPRLPDRACLTGILFVLRSGIPWEMLPQELGCGSGMTCWRRLRDWQEAGIWQLIHFSLLDWLARYGEIDWSRAVGDAHGIVLTAYWATVVMTPSQSAKVCVHAALCLGSQSATPNMAADWGNGAGWSSGRSPG